MTIWFAMIEAATGEKSAAFFLRESQAPEGAVAITEARHAALLDAQAGGARIVAGKGGKPQVERSNPDAATRRDELARAIKREAARRIELVAPVWRQLNDARSPSPEGARRFAQVDAIRAASGEIEAALTSCKAAALDAFPIRENPLWPVFD